jgi:peptidyl-tRNA hydrolase
MHQKVIQKNKQNNWLAEWILKNQRKITIRIIKLQKYLKQGKGILKNYKRSIIGQT